MPGNWAVMMACDSSSAERLAGVWLSEIVRIRSIGGPGSGRSGPSGRSPVAPLGGRDDAGDDGVVVKPGARRGGGEAGIGRKARIDVHLQNRRAPGGVDAEIDPCVTAEREQPPGCERQLAQRGDKGRV